MKMLNSALAAVAVATLGLIATLAVSSGRERNVNEAYVSDTLNAAASQGWAEVSFQYDGSTLRCKARTGVSEDSPFNLNGEKARVDLPRVAPYNIVAAHHTERGWEVLGTTVLPSESVRRTDFESHLKACISSLREVEALRHAQAKDA